MSRAFYPFVEDKPKSETPKSPDPATQLLGEVRYATRIAIYDDPSAAPRVVVVDPSDIRSYLEEITSEVSRLSREQGGHIPFMVIREVVENLIHAYFIEPAISILDDGDTIRFADQGPGIKEKARALEYGTTSATEEMKRYIRGVGSGLPYAQQYLHDHGGMREIEDNILGGTIVTISMKEVPSDISLSQTSPHTMPVPAISLSLRGEKIIEWLSTHDTVGPKDLVGAYGSSQSTWTRELQALEQAGVVSKRGGQKRYLTAMGKTLIKQ